ncbi:MAG: hypothetical protein ACQKBY_02910, partial [Verrucomicrobiales bacterium]
MKLPLALTASFLALDVTSAASVIVNGSLDTWSGGNVSNWTEDNGTSTDFEAVEVAGLDGSGSAVQLTIVSGTSNTPSLTQNFSTPADELLLLQFDFRQLTTGTNTGNGRIMNVTLRDGFTSIFNIRVNDEGGANDGRIQIFNGSGWSTLTGSELINEEDNYRVSLDFDFTAGNYDLEVLNLT